MREKPEMAELSEAQEDALAAFWTVVEPAAGQLPKRVQSALQRGLDAAVEAVEARVRAELEPKLKILAEYENAITWNTTCLGCAGKLDNLIAERAAGYAEAAEEIALALARLAAEQREQYSRKKTIGVDDQAREHAIRFRTFTHAKEIAREHARPAAGTDQPRCPNCEKFGVPARVEHCGPGCHEAHTYVAPCEWARRRNP